LVSLLPFIFGNLLNCFRFAKDEDDGLIEREIMSGEAGRMLVYTVEVHTGDVNGAGTDANVFIALDGNKVLLSSFLFRGKMSHSHFLLFTDLNLLTFAQGSSGRRKLRSLSNNFERAKVDTFEFKSCDLGMECFFFFPKFITSIWLSKLTGVRLFFFFF
jgi:hypothetical protein